MNPAYVCTYACQSPSLTLHPMPIFPEMAAMLEKGKHEYVFYSVIKLLQSAQEYHCKLCPVIGEMRCAKAEGRKNDYCNDADPDHRCVGGCFLEDIYLDKGRIYDI